MSYNVPSGKAWKIRPLYLEALKFFLPGLLLLITAFGVHFAVLAHEQKILVAQEESLKVEQTQKRLEQQILQMQTDTLRFAELVGQQPELALKGDAVARQFSHIMAFKPQYMQVRFLSTEGIERVRLDRVHDNVNRQPADLLQDKSHRPYFKRGIVSEPGQVYLSPLDYNVEWHRPQTNRLTMRMATPVFTDSGEKLGLLVINYNGTALLEELLGVFEDTQNPDKSFGTFRLTNNHITVEFTQADNQKVYFTVLEEAAFFEEQSLSKNQTVPDKGQLWQSEERLTTFSSLSPLGGTGRSPWRVSHTTSMQDLIETRPNVIASTPVYAALLIILGVGSRLQAGHRLTIRQVQEERLHQLTRIVEQSPSAIMLTDSDARIFYTNAAFTRLTGYQSDEVKGKTPGFLRSGRTAPECYRTLWNTLKQGQPWHGEFHNQRKDGSLFWEAALIFPVSHPWNHETCYVAIKQDISREKDLQEKLQQETEARLHQEQLAKIGRTANMIAHDLRNPLTSVKMSLQMAQRRALRSVDRPARQDKLWGLALGQVNYMERILEGILNYSHQGQLHLQELDTNALLQSIMTEMEEGLLGAQVRLSWNLADQLPTVKADPVKLRQVFQNLAANALQATEASRGERTIDIESRFVHKKSGAFVQITITNSGIELDKQTKDQAFEPFFTTRAKGTGLGLAIVKNHVLRHGGQVNIESSDGVIKVCVALPLSPPASLFKESISRGERSLMHAVNEESRTYGTHSDH
ncbi:MAG: hypothetical protein CMG91_12820 [Marinobacter sp.]|nr:hypothetical protein [Marinobacter sp.]|tara:strand:+ start:3209 stop:5455 length:2247 start_codon:yes stop_codon:yes gene_type:complete